jgi:AcrR family transcriptional regulator
VAAVTARRDALARAASRYLLQHGVGGLSLRPLAAATGTSARLLIYHFGSRERLLIAAMAVIREDLRAEVRRLLDDAPDAEGLDQLVRRFWRWCTLRRHRPYLRLIFEVHGLALQAPDAYAGYIHGAIAHWIELLSARLEPRVGRARAEPTATLIVGMIDGLLLDYLSTKDLRRTTAAMELFAARLGAGRRTR